MTLPLAAPLQGPVTLSLPFSSESAAEVRRALAHWLAHHGSPEPVINDARLVATELVANALRHAGPLSNATLLVRWHQEGRELALSVSDGGGSSTPALRESHPDAENGRGLAIVQALCVRWKAERSNNVHTVHVALSMD